MGYNNLKINNIYVLILSIIEGGKVLYTWLKLQMLQNQQHLDVHNIIYERLLLRKKCICDMNFV